MRCSTWITVGSDAAHQAAVDAVGLPARGLAALVLVGSHPSCSVDWLVRRLGITQSGTVRLLDRLESAELITRDRRPGRREVEVTVTVTGRRLLARDRADAACRLCDWSACADTCPVDVSVTRPGQGGE